MVLFKPGSMENLKRRDGGWKALETWGFTGLPGLSPSVASECVLEQFREKFTDLESESCIC